MPKISQATCFLKFKNSPLPWPNATLYIAAKPTPIKSKRATTSAQSTFLKKIKLIFISQGAYWIHLRRFKSGKIAENKADESAKTESQDDRFWRQNKSPVKTELGSG